MKYTKAKPTTRYAKKVYKKKAPKRVGAKPIGTRALQGNGANHKAARMTARSSLNKASNAVIQQTYFCTMPYFDRVSLTHATDYNYILFNANSLVDPYYAVGGHQPRGFDQISALYNGYQVYAVEVSVDFFTKDTTREGFKVGIVGTDSFKLTWTDALEMEEYTNENILWTTLNDMRPTATVRRKFFCSELQNVTKKQYNIDSGFRAGIGANPLIMPKIHVLSHTLDGTTSTFGVEANVSLLYYCRFFDPRNFASS